MSSTERDALAASVQINAISAGNINKKLYMTKVMLNESAFVDWTPFEGEDIYPHPTKICEPLNLACTSLPALVYKMNTAFVPGTLSTIQIETIRRIFQSFSTRGGFLLGDATGVGKGRTIAGVLHECKTRDTAFRALWVSANGRLKSDAEKEILAVSSVQTLTENLLFSSYSTLLNVSKFEACVAFMTENADDSERLIILDECHALRNNSTTAERVEELIQSIPNVNILYSSATAASSVKHLQYLNRLQLWGPNTPFASYSDLTTAMKGHGASLMELLSIQMRSCGAYVSRQLSFSDIVMEQSVITLCDSERDLYDKCSRMLVENGILGGSIHQKFFQKLITGIKTKHVIDIAKKRLQLGDSVVISLMNTGDSFAHKMEANTYKSYPQQHRVCEDMFERLGTEVDATVPLNPIDQIMNAFGHNNVAELTGRRIRVAKGMKGMYKYTADTLEEEARKFQTGEKRIAVLSRAGGVGISLHDNIQGRRRSHIILEMPWSAEDFLQQIGRTHRSNSLSSPYYILPTTNIPAEMRFASAIVHKLASMGALVRGDRSFCDVKWLNVPNWNPNTKRSIGLFLSFAKAFSTLTSTQSTQLLDYDRNAAMRACGYSAHSRNVSDIVLKTTLTAKLNSNDNTTEDLLNYTSAAKALFVHDVSSLILNWSPNTHNSFPQPFKKRVFALLMSYSAWETRNTLGMLPESVLHYIIEIMSVPATLATACKTADCFMQHSLRLNDLSHTSTDIMLNKLLGMEVDIQEAVFSFTTFATLSTPPFPVSCFMRYIRDRVGHAIETTISEIRYRSFGGGVNGIEVIMSFKANQIEYPPDGTEIWKHSRSNRTAWIKGNQLVCNDGMYITLEETSQSCVENKGYSIANMDDWNMCLRRHQASTAKRIRKLHKKYIFATENALKSWDNSMRRVLRIPPCIQFPRGLVGLLMMISS